MFCKLSGQLSYGICISILAVSAGCSSVSKETVSHLELGKTNDNDVERLLGHPRSVEDTSQNGVSARIYTYYDYTTQSIGPYLIANYSLLGIETRAGLLDGYIYYRSDGGSATRFDLNKMNLIVEGSTTREQAIALLGKPTGHAEVSCGLQTYQVSKPDATGKLLAWTDAPPAKRVFGSGMSYATTLVVQFDDNGIAVAKTTHTMPMDVQYGSPWSTGVAVPRL